MNIKNQDQLDKQDENEKWHELRIKSLFVEFVVLVYYYYNVYKIYDIFYQKFYILALFRKNYKCIIEFILNWTMANKLAL